MVRTPATVAVLFSSCKVGGIVTQPWGRLPPIGVPREDGGIYVVSVRNSIVAKPGRIAPTALPHDVASRWHLRQPVVYIGKTERNLRARLGEFYRHKLGNHSPHRGGEDLLRLVAERWPLWVYWAQVPPTKASEIEARMLQRFAAGLPDGAEHRLPFGNRQRGRRQGSFIEGSDE